MLIKDAAANAADELLRAYWPERTFPVDPFALAHRLGVDTRLVVMEDGVSGMVVANQDGQDSGLQATIFVDSTHVAQRRAFTCAHELGHYAERVLTSRQGEESFAFVDRRTSRSDAHEFYANEFAGNLLMPADEVARLEKQGASTAEMARHFGVSIPAMDVRLRRLELDARVRGQ